MRRGKDKGGDNMGRQIKKSPYTFTTGKGVFMPYMVLPELTPHYPQVLP